MASPSSPVLQKLPRTLQSAYSSLSACLPCFPAPHSSQPTGLPTTSPSSPALLPHFPAPHSSQSTGLPTASQSLPALQKLHRLAVSSPDYCDNLYEVLHEEDYQECAANLRGDDLTWLVDYLDKVCSLHRPLHPVLNLAQALDGLEPSSEAYRKCMHELRTICGTNGILPTSFASLSQLQYTSPEPFAEGARGEVFHGTLDGSKVCIKRIKVYTKDSPEKAMKVCL